MCTWVWIHKFVESSSGHYLVKTSSGTRNKIIPMKLLIKEKERRKGKIYWFSLAEEDPVEMDTSAIALVTCLSPCLGCSIPWVIFMPRQAFSTQWQNGHQTLQINIILRAGIFKRERDLLPVSMLLLLSRFSRVQLCDPRNGSLLGSSVPGILQARILEWVAISFSNAWKWKVKVKSLSRVRLLANPWTATYQALPSMGFSRQEYWSGVPLPSPKDVLEPS